MTFGLMPLMSRANHRIIGASTPKMADHGVYYYIVTEKDEHGNSVYNTITLGSPCAECVKNQIEYACMHNRDQLPAHKLISNGQTIWDRLYELVDAEEVRNTEMGIKFSGKEEQLFPARYTDKLTSSLLKDAALPEPLCIYVSLDPGGGGKNGQMAMTSIARYEDYFGVCYFYFSFYFFKMKIF